MQTYIFYVMELFNIRKITREKALKSLAEKKKKISEKNYSNFLNKENYFGKQMHSSFHKG